MYKCFDCLLFAKTITLDVVDLLNKTKHTRQNSTRLLPTILAVVQFNVLLTNQEQQTIISICADNCLSGVFGLVNVCVFIGGFWLWRGAPKGAQFAMRSQITRTKA